MKPFLRSKLVLSLAALIMIAAAIAVSLSAPFTRLHTAQAAARPFSDVYVKNSGDNTVSAINGNSKKVVATIPTGANGVGAQGLAFTPSGNLLYVATNDGPGTRDIVVIDTARGSKTFNQIIATITISITINGITFDRAQFIFIDPLGRFLYFSGTSGVGVIDIRDGSPTRYQVIAAVSGITIGIVPQAAFSPDGKELWWPEDGGFGHPSGVAIINTDPSSPGFNTATEISLPDGFNPQGISISPDGSKVYLSGWGSNVIRVMDRLSRSVITDISGGDGFAPRGNVISSDGARLYAVTDGNTVLRAYNATNNSFIDDVILDNTVNGVHFVALSGNNTRAYINASNQNALLVVDVTTSPPTLLATIKVGNVPSGVAVRP